MTASFYDKLAPVYHLLYGDWEASIRVQGRSLSKLLSELGVENDAHVHDAAAGIGTQTIGLLQAGYAVSASDLSEAAIARLDTELRHRSLNARTFISDLRTLEGLASDSLQAILACDNSIPHLLTDADILTAFQQCYRVLQSGGVAVFSVRDYSRIERRSPDVRPYGLRIEGNRRFLAVQVWEWEEEQYNLSMYLTSELSDGTCATEVLRSRYYAISIERLLELLVEAGFVGVERRDDVLFQPVFWGRKNA
jgi:SAM-dependent methyltransferase